MQSTASPTIIREATESVWQLGAYVALTLALFVFFGLLMYKRLVPQWIKTMDERSSMDKERELWARQQVERAQSRLDQTYDKIPGALTEIASRMEEANRINREAFAKLFEQHTRILERLPWPDPRESGQSGRATR